MTTRTKILEYYKNNCADHIDPKTNELDITRLAEDAIDALGLNERQEEIAFDMVVDFEADNANKSLNLGGIFVRFDNYLIK